jgi:DNA-directed RNA polymerase
VPADRPADIYQDVVERVLDLLAARAVDDDLSALWLRSGLITRSLIKRPVMTYVYGSKRYGFSDQLGSAIRAMPNWRQEIAPLFHNAETNRTKLGAACRVLAELVWQALQDMTSGAAQGMQWFQRAGAALALHGPVQWEVPGTGFQVTQPYMKLAKKQVKTFVAGRVIQPCAYLRTDQVAKRKQVTALAPNLVHSLDAACLQHTVIDAQSRGITAFSVIHDSYGTHAADAELLAQTLRQSFVTFYANQDVVYQFHQQWHAIAGDDIPEPPRQGDLDISGVLASRYFFS